MFEEYFNKSRGKPFEYKGKTIKLSDHLVLPSKNVTIKFTFLSVDSIWKQGAVLSTNGEFLVNNKSIMDSIVIWQDIAPLEISILVKSQDKKLIVYNVWDTGKGTMHYGHNGAAIYVDEIGNERVYYCNDGQPNDDFNDLIFKIELF